jgi:hypothetical protein
MLKIQAQQRPHSEFISGESKWRSRFRRSEQVGRRRRRLGLSHDRKSDRKWQRHRASSRSVRRLHAGHDSMPDAQRIQFPAPLPCPGTTPVQRRHHLFTTRQLKPCLPKGSTTHPARLSSFSHGPPSDRLSSCLLCRSDGYSSSRLQILAARARVRCSVCFPSSWPRALGGRSRLFVISLKTNLRK